MTGAHEKPSCIPAEDAGVEELRQHLRREKEQVYIEGVLCARKPGLVLATNASVEHVRQHRFSTEEETEAARLGPIPWRAPALGLPVGSHSS